MATRAERIRQGQSAKERVLSGNYNTPTTSTPTNRRTAAINTYTANKEAEKQQQQEIYKAITNPVNLFGLREQADRQAQQQQQARQESKIKQDQVANQLNPLSRMQAGLASLPAPTNTESMIKLNNDPVAKLLQTNTPLGRNLEPKTEYERRQRILEQTDAPAWTKAVPSALNWALYGNPIGNTITRALPSDPNMVMRESTGNKALDKTTDISQMLTSVAVPTGAPLGGGNLAAPYKAADAVMQGTRVGMAAERGLATGLSKIKGINPNTANAMAREVVREGVAGAIQSPAIDLTNDPNRSATELATSAGLGSLLGAGLGGAVPAIAQPIKQYINDRSLTNLIRNADLPIPEQRFISSPSQVPSNGQRVDEYVNSLMNRSGTPARVGTATTLENALERIKPIVTEKMTPPLENQNELARWIQRNLNLDDLSLNEIRKMNYYEMSSLATDIKNSLNLEGVVRETASELGIDWDRLMNPSQRNITADSLQRGRDAMRMREVAGLDPLVRNETAIGRNIQNNAVTPASTELPVVDPNAQPILRPSQFQDNTGLGITPFGNRTKPYDSLSTDTRSQLTTRQVKEPKTVSKEIDKLYTALVDDFHPLNKQDKILDRIMGDELPASERTHTLALNSRGADVVSKQIITDGLVNSNGEVVGESLKDILKGLPKQEGTKYKNIYVDFEDYLLNKHAITRDARGEKVFRDSLQWTPEFGQQKVNEYEAMFPEFKETADRLYQFNKDMVQTWLVDEGIITQAQADAWYKANPYYVPNKRYFTELEKGSSGITKSKRGVGNQSNPVKGYNRGGGQQKIISPLEATIENVDAFVKTAKRNKVMQQYVKNIESHPEAFSDWAEIVNKPKGQVDDVTKMISEGQSIDDILGQFADDFDAGFQKTKLDRDNIIRVLVDGNPVHVKIKDQPLLNAITAMGPEQGNALLDAVGGLTNMMKNLTTGSNPVFSLTRNVFRDIPQAYIASKSTSNPLKFATDLITASYETLFRKDAYKEFINIGGGHSSPIAANRNLMAQSKGAILPSNPFKGALPKAYRGYENFLNVMETAPRLAEFKRTANMSGDLQKALHAAQDVTTNFKRRGTLTRSIDKVFPYFNAAIQGLDQVARVYKDNPVKALTKTALALSLPAMALYAINYNNPDYQKLSDRTKDNFFNIPIGDGKFIKIAKPQEQGTIFTALPERLMRLFYEQDPEAFKGFADQLRTTIIPPGISGLLNGEDVISGVLNDTIFGAAVQTVANKSWNGAPIVPANLERLSPEFQSDAKTSSLAKSIGETIGYSPKKIDYLLKQYTGVFGQLGLPLLSSGGDLGYSLQSQMVADSVFSNDISTQFYENKEKLDQAYNDRELKKLPDWYSDLLRKRLNKLSKNMSSVRKEIRDVQSNQLMSNATKRDRLRELQEKINSYAETGNELADKYMKK